MPGSTQSLALIQANWKLTRGSRVALSGAISAWPGTLNWAGAGGLSSKPKGLTTCQICGIDKVTYANRNNGARRCPLIPFKKPLTAI